MDKQQVELIIKPDGTVEESVSGVSGPDCELLTESFEKALGVVTKREKKAEYYNEAQKHSGSVSVSS
jgi:hypothetical protein